MDILLPVFQLLYFVVHFLFSLAQAVYGCAFELWHFLSYIIWIERWFEPSRKIIQRDISMLKRLPRHIGFVFIPGQTSNFVQICKVIKWCNYCGINTITLYDIDGTLKLQLHKLLKHLQQFCNGVVFKIILDSKEQHEELYFYEDKNGSDENLQYSKDNHCHSLSEQMPKTYKIGVNLNIFSINSGRSDLVKICKNYTSANILDSNLIQEELITKGQVDPDLVIVLGRPACSLGFLPWQCRLTEFSDIPSLSRLSYSEFKRQLFSFARCEQRFGT